MSDYRNWPFRFVDKGLNITLPPDRLEEGQYSILTNVKSLQEGGITSRGGLSTLLTNVSGGIPIHTIRRLDDNTLFIGAGQGLYYNNNQYGVAANQIPGTPLQPVRFKPALSSAAWTYLGLGGSARGVKVLGDGTFYYWGITASGSGAAAVSAGPGNLDSSVTGGSPYNWRYTYYSSATGAESNGSPQLPGIDLTSEQASVTIVASSDPQVDTIKLYRQGGSIASSWRLVATLGNANQVYIDNSADSTIANTISMLLDNDVPFGTVTTNGTVIYGASFPYVWGPFNGKYIMAVGDNERPGYVYWTNPDRPDSASSANNISVTAPTEPLINGFLYGSLPYVWSRDNLYALDFGGPTALPTFKPRLMPLGMGLAAPWAFVATGPLIFFLGHDGIYATDGTKAIPLTEDSMRPIFQGENAGDFFAIDKSNATTMRMAFAGQELHFWYVDMNGDPQHIFYNVMYKRWKKLEPSPTTMERMGYADENQNSTRLYLGGDNGDIYENDVGNTDAGAEISSQVRTPSFDMEIPGTFKEFGNVILDLSTDTNSGPVTVTPYYDAETIVGTPTVVNTLGRQKVAITLDDFYAHSVALDFTWEGGAPVLYQLEYLWRDDEEEVSHWEAPPTSHGLIGWQHIRDGYFCLRSTEDVTLTILIDGVVSGPYTLSSTGGEKRKVYVKFNASKGKMFQYFLECSAPFRFYGEDTEVRVKIWNTVMGYQNVKPFQSLGYAPFLRKGAGT